MKPFSVSSLTRGTISLRLAFQEEVEMSRSMQKVIPFDMGVILHQNYK